MSIPIIDVLNDNPYERQCQISPSAPELPGLLGSIANFINSAECNS